MSENDKLDLSSPDLVNENFEKLAELFPNCVTESAEGKAIDFDLLKQELSHAVVEGNKERYRLEWPGKKEAIVTANLPTTKTLRPVREDSVDFDNTENLYIEGDNLEVLKLLQESYLGKIKMIYIDPPYNTGKDFVYKDNYSKDSQEELLESGQKDEYNQKLVANPETSGRYHSDWLSMMYPRLKLARNLLTEDGLIFVSIDENEFVNLKKVLNEIFGDVNYVGEFVWKNKHGGGGDSPFIVKEHEFIIFFSKNINALPPMFAQPTDSYEKMFREEDKRGKFYFDRLDKKGIDSNRPNLIYPIECPDGTMKDISPAIWRLSKPEFERRKALNQIGFKKDKHGDWQIYTKTYLFDEEGNRRKVKARSILKQDQVGFTQNGNKEMDAIFGSRLFQNPKPVDLLKYLIDFGTEKDSIVLDFFSGSATAANSILQLNAEDKGRRKFIQVQIPEETDEKSLARKKGYTTIPEIGKERIRRAAKKIKEETGADIDYGFRVYCLDESNMEDVYYKPQEYSQDKLDLFADNVKSGRTSDDLLAQVMLDWGLPLSLKIEQANINGKKLFKVAENSLYACFDDDIDEAFAKAIAEEQPLRIVFKDSGFKDDTAKTNVKQLLKQLSPETEMKVI